MKLSTLVSVLVLALVACGGASSSDHDAAADASPDAAEDAGCQGGELYDASCWPDRTLLLPDGGDAGAE